MTSVSFQLLEPLLGHKLDHDLEGGHFMTISSPFASGKGFVDRPLNVLLLD